MTDDLRKVREALELASASADFIEKEFFAKSHGHAPTARAARDIYLAANEALAILDGIIQRGEAEVVCVPAEIERPEVAMGMKFKLRYLEYENDAIGFSTGPIHVLDLQQPSPATTQPDEAELLTVLRKYLKHRRCDDEWFMSGDEYAAFRGELLAIETKRTPPAEANIANYVNQRMQEAHEKAPKDVYESGRFWAYKDVQQYLRRTAVFTVRKEK